MSIRLRCVNRTLSTGTHATVLESLAPLFTPGDGVTFRLDEASPGDGEVTLDGRSYRVGNVRLLEDVEDARFTLVECELADDETRDER